MRARKLQTAVRREQIARAALDLVAGGGIRALQVAAIARRVGVVPSAVYRHYPGKQAILDTVLELIRHRLEENVRQARAATPDALDRLGLLLTAQAALLTTHPAIPSVIFSEEIFGGSPEQRRRAGDVARPYLRAIARMVSEGQQAGAIRADLAARTIALLVLGVIQPAAVIAHLDAGRFDLERHVRQAWPVLRRGIATAQSTEAKKTCDE